MSINVLSLITNSRIIITILVISIVILYCQQQRSLTSTENIKKILNRLGTNHKKLRKAQSGGGSAEATVSYHSPNSTAGVGNTKLPPTLSSSTVAPVDYLNETNIFKRYCDILTNSKALNLSTLGLPYIGRCLKLEYPIMKIYVRETEYTNCYDYESCKSTFRTEQLKFSYSRASNFLIGGDGSIFEATNCRTRHRNIDSKSVVVSLTGWSCGRTEHQDTHYEVNSKQYSSLKLFIKANLINGNLSPYYQLLPYCCTSVATKLGPANPGKTVYENLTRFERFNGDGCLRNAKCHYED